MTASDFYRPYNPGNALGSNHSPELPWFALLDPNNPLRKITLDTDGTLAKEGFGREWFLNFQADQGPLDEFWAKDTAYGPLPTDGDDRIFGDLGNDWVVGGTGRDSMYGGWGDDLINADDDLTTNGGLNNKTDTNPSYEDFAYGGAGRDILIGNTAGDRLVDWSKGSNVFFLPFVNAGLPTVISDFDHSVEQFLLDLSESQGSDLTLAEHYTTDPARNGEPLGELGIVIDGDAAWADQQLPFNMAQPGNLQTDPDVAESAGKQPIWQIAATATLGGDGTVIATSDLAPIVAGARALWAEALGDADPRLAILNGVTIEVGNLPADALGVTLGRSILIDRDAAGWGWFVDPTPGDSGEFPMHLWGGALGAVPMGLASGRMDLLSTVLHEMGNAMGLPETLNQDVSGMYLAAGIRTLPPSRVDGNGAQAPTINWTSRYGGATPTNQTHGWVDDFLNNGGQDETFRNPNAGLRLRAPNG